MDPGRLDRRITIERRTASGTDPTYGTATFSTTTIGPLWAHVAVGTGGESEAASQLVGSRRWVFTLYFRSDLSQGDVVVFDGRRFDVTDVRELGFREWSVLDAVAKDQTP